MNEQDLREEMLRVAGLTDGMAWVDLLLQKHGRVAFEMTWMFFMIGQMGAMLEVIQADAGRKKELESMFEAFEEGIGDFRTAAAELADEADNIISNAKRNLRKLSKKT